MVLTITPGYDFTINEVPTSSKFQQQAAGLVMSDIPLSNVDASLNVIKIADSTTASIMPNEGSMWVDHQLNVWGRTRWGALKIRTTGGVLETNRFATKGGTNSVVDKGWRCELGDGGTRDSTSSCPGLVRSGVDPMSSIFNAQDTITSGSDGEYFRAAVGPGFLGIFHTWRAPAVIGTKQLIGNVSPTTQYFTLQGLSDNIAEGLLGDIMAEQTYELAGVTCATNSTAYLYGGLIGKLEIT